MDTSRRLRRALPVAALTTLAVAAPALAADGDLDTTFNGSGIITWKLGLDDGAEAPSEAHDAVVDSAGRLLMAGGADVQNGVRFALGRLLPNGDPDESFSGDGIVRTLVGEGGTAHAVALQSDGKIVVAGDASSEVTSVPQFAVARYEENGTPDETFGGGDGIVTTPVIPGSGVRASAFDAAVQGDGDIVVAGYAPFASDKNLPRFVVARYDSDGELDEGFDGDGIANVRVGQFGGKAHALLLQPGGKVVVGGDASESWGQGFGLARFTSTGALDETFGAGGTTVTRLALPDTPETMSVDNEIRGLTQDPAGRIVAAGMSEDTQTRFGVARYSADGIIDTTFGTGGFVRTPVGSYAEAHDVVVQPGGRILAVGETGSSTAEYAVAALTPAGAPDTTFSGDGIATTALGSWGAVARAALLTPDGKGLYAVGSGFNGHGAVRYAITDAVVEEPKKDEPKKDEPKKDEPKKDEPKKEQPKQAAPVVTPVVPVVVPVVQRAQPQKRRCVSRRLFTVDLRTLGIVRDGKVVALGAKGRRATLALDGLSVEVDLRKLPKGTYGLKLSGRKKNGRRVSLTKQYRTCA